MTKVRFVGLDVHKQTVVIAVCDEAGGEPAVVATVPNELAVVQKKVRRLGELSSLKVCYEAGPTGFELCRELLSAGVDCVVVAPSKVPRMSGDRVKTDRRDAQNLARYLRSGDLTAIQLPNAEDEAMRDLVRARQDALDAERAARHQLVKFLLRHGRKYQESKSWTGRHMDWIRKQNFEYEAQNRVLVDYVRAVEVVTARVEQLTNDITELSTHWKQRPVVEALQALRGIRLISAATLVAEIGNFHRFQSAPAFMAYLGLVPSEASSGETRRQGKITKSGNGHVRKTLVESSWSYRHRAAMSRELKARNEGLPSSVTDAAWKAQQRLNGRYKKLNGKGKPKQRVITAIARELAGFVWHIARQVQPLAA
jgi:transposase